MKLLHGDCRKLILEASIAASNGSVDAVITDPPYEIGIAGQSWDATGVAHDPETWKAFGEALLKPGGYLLAFGATRNHHRMTCAIEDAGFEIQDEIPWLYAQGYPKSRGLLKPANEPIVVARNAGAANLHAGGAGPGGKWAANVAMDEHVWEYQRETTGMPPFAFVAKPHPGERRLGAIGAYHETVKPLKLMRWLVELVSEPGDTILDPFMGTGTTIAAALIAGRDAIGIEKGWDSFKNAEVRIADLVAPYGLLT